MNDSNKRANLVIKDFFSSLNEFDIADEKKVIADLLFAEITNEEYTFVDNLKTVNIVVEHILDK